MFKKHLGCINMLKSMFSIVESSFDIGVKTIDIDKKIQNYMYLYNLESAPIKYYNYSSYACPTVDKYVCHGVGSDYEINSKTIMKMDISFYYKKTNHNYDATRIFVMPDIDSSVLQLVGFAKFAIDYAIQMTNYMIRKTGKFNYLSLGKNYEYIVEKYSDYQICTTFGGHKVGVILHEAPFIPGYDVMKYTSNTKMIQHVKNNMNDYVAKAGDMFCFEPIIAINNGSDENIFSVDPHTALHTHDNCYEENMYCFDGEKIIILT